MGSGQSSDQPAQVAITPSRGAPSDSAIASGPALAAAHSAGASRRAADGTSPPPLQQTPIASNKAAPGRWEYAAAQSSAVANASGTPWQVFTDATNERLEEAFKDGRPRAEIMLGRQVYQVDFAQCVMWAGASTGPKTGVNAVRRLLLTDDGSAASADDDTNRELFQSAGVRQYATDGRSVTIYSNNTAAAKRRLHQHHHHSNRAPGGGEHGTAAPVGQEEEEEPPLDITLAATAKAHNSLIYCAAFDTDGKSICTGGRDGTLRWWELDTGLVLRNFDPVSAVILNAAIAPGKTLVASGSDDALMRLYNPAQSSPVLTCSGHHHKVYGVDFTSDSRHIFTGAMDNTNKLWDTRTAVCLNTFRAHSAAVFTLRCSRLTPNLAISGGDDNKLCSFDLRAGDNRPTGVYEGHTATIWACDIRFDEMVFATAGMDGQIFLWDARKPGSNHLALVGSHGKSPIHDVEFSPDGKKLISCARDATWKLWDTEAALEDVTATAATTSSSSGRRSSATGASPYTNNLVANVHAHDGVVFAISYSALRGQVLSIGADAFVRLWNARL